MILEYGNMWDIFGKTDLFVITTNSTIKNNGCLVMGRGIAKQARDRLVGIDRIAAQNIEQCPIDCYGFITIGNFDFQNIGIFQVKTHFRNKADIELIRISTENLFGHLIRNSNIRVDMNFPGIGYGGLVENEVLPIISLLPDNVHIWRYENEKDNNYRIW